MSAHTPGPVAWGVNWANGKVSIFEQHADGTREVVAIECAPPTRLTAAAPELLKTLQELVAEWDTRHAEEDHRSGYTLDTAGIAMARAAIAKATGEAA